MQETKAIELNKTREIVYLLANKLPLVINGFNKSSTWLH